MKKDFDLDKAIRKVPNFPKPGILFYDITSILINPQAFQYCLDQMASLYGQEKLDAVCAIESRGFIFAARFGLPFILIRKKGKLPGETLRQEFSLEYGTDTIEVHKADLKPGWHVILVDDLIATGGTLKAACQMLEQAMVKVNAIFAVIGLPFLKYEEVLKGYQVRTLINYDSEEIKG